MSKLKLSSNASGSGNVTLESPNTDSDRTLTLPDSTGTVATLGTALTLATAVTASGTAVDFTSIPSWVKRITVMLAGVSTNGSSNLLIQLGDSGGVETTGYLGTGFNSAAGGAAYTTGFGNNLLNVSGAVMHGAIAFQHLSANAWVASGVFARTDAAAVGSTAGSKTLSATLDRIRITTVNGTDTFDAGTINILYEG